MPVEFVTAWVLFTIAGVLISKKELVIVMEMYWTSVAFVVDQGFLTELVIVMETYWTS